MLTRLEVDGFKNLVDFALDFGPYTCVAGLNGAGKSNVFDAIHFLSLLTECGINEAALQLRSVGAAGETTGEIADLFFAADGRRRRRMRFAAEMIVDKTVTDDFGREAKPSSSFLRYEVAFRRERPSPASGPLGGLVLEREELRPITAGRSARHLKFPHHKGRFRDSVVYNKRHSRSPYIDTEEEGERTTILVHQDGGSRGRGRPAPAEGATRTIIGTENTVATPTILAARREMRSWRILALEPSAMRRPDRYTQTPALAANGAHLPATLQRLANLAPRYGDDADDVFAMITSRLSDLIPVKRVRVAQDDVRQLLSLEIEDPDGLTLRAGAISDGTLRFLALAVLAEVSDEPAVLCMEEPENGIHPGNLPAMNTLLHDIAVDANQPAGMDNPLRQVIVATHSPYFVQLQDEDDLVLAKNARSKKAGSRKWRVVRRLKCRPLSGSWRCSASGPGQQGIDRISLQSWLMPPEEARITLRA